MGRTTTRGKEQGEERKLEIRGQRQREKPVSDWDCKMESDPMTFVWDSVLAARLDVCLCDRGTKRGALSMMIWTGVF